MMYPLSEPGFNIDPSTGQPYPGPTGHTDYRAGFDTGLISPNWQSDWSAVTAPPAVTPAAVRPYGKGAKPYTDIAQPRKAYCALYEELLGKDVPAQQTGVPCA
jgi:hypothetical protein